MKSFSHLTSHPFIRGILYLLILVSCLWLIGWFGGIGLDALRQLATMQMEEKVGQAQRVETEKLYQAQARWKENKLTSYDLLIEKTTMPFYIGYEEKVCKARVEIRKDQASLVDAKNCPDIPLTVEAFFVEAQIQSAFVLRGPNGIECDGAMVYHMAYDEKLGYPSQLEPVLLPPGQQFFGFCHMAGLKVYIPKYIIHLLPAGDP